MKYNRVKLLKIISKWKSKKNIYLNDVHKIKTIRYQYPPLHLKRAIDNGTFKFLESHKKDINNAFNFAKSHQELMSFNQKSPNDLISKKIKLVNNATGSIESRQKIINSITKITTINRFKPNQIFSNQLNNNMSKLPKIVEHGIGAPFKINNPIGLTAPVTIFSKLQNSYNSISKYAEKYAEQRNNFDWISLRIKYIKRLNELGWVEPIKYDHSLQFYKHMEKDGYSEIDINLYKFLSDNNYLELKEEFNSLIKNLKLINSENANGYYNQMKSAYFIFVKDTSNVILLMPLMFILLEFLNLNTDQADVFAYKDIINYGYFKRVVKNDQEKLSDYNKFVVAEKLYLFIDDLKGYSYDGTNLNRNPIEHGFANPNDFNVKDFMKMILLCRGFSSVVLDKK